MLPVGSLDRIFVLLRFGTVSRLSANPPAAPRAPPVTTNITQDTTTPASMDAAIITRGRRSLPMTSKVFAPKM